MSPISPSVELLTMQVVVLRAIAVIHYMCSLKVIFKKALKNQCIMKQPPNVSSEGRWLWADWGLNGLTSCTFTEIVIWTGHNKGKNYCSPKRSRKIRAHTSSIAVSTQILITQGWQSIISMYAYILEKSAVQREFSGILKQEWVRDRVTDPGISAEAITKPHLENCQNILKNDKLCLNRQWLCCHTLLSWQLLKKGHLQCKTKSFLL